MNGKEKVVEYVWQDRELRFDSKPPLLACRRGEKIIDSIRSVEDTKGNNGERGSLIVTNLRILLIAHENSKINLSIGLNSIISVNIRKAKSNFVDEHKQYVCSHKQHQDSSLYLRNLSKIHHVCLPQSKL